MTREEWEWYRKMKLSQVGSVRTAVQWAIFYNVPVEDIRDGYRPTFTQGMTVLRLCEWTRG